MTAFTPGGVDASGNFLWEGGLTLAERAMYFDYQGQAKSGTDVIGAGSPGTFFYFAEGTTRPGFTSYFSLANFGSQSAYVRITYFKGDSATRRRNWAFPPTPGIR
ncbi:MAG: hypothetical protein SWK76_15990 [Actinomycetota bacterium]|nr:hypothetical protein [Actinomycetota bacterium]